MTRIGVILEKPGSLICSVLQAFVVCPYLYREKNRKNYHKKCDIDMVDCGPSGYGLGSCSLITFSHLCVLMAVIIVRKNAILNGGIFKV